MISRRLTKDQKAEIVEAYRAGENTNSLAEKYACSTNTINRTVKTLLSDTEYKSLKKKRSKINNRKTEDFKNEIFKEKLQESGQSNALISFENQAHKENQCVKVKDDFNCSKKEKIASLAHDDADDFGDDQSSDDNQNIDKNIQNFDNNFEEIAPLISNFDFDNEKQKLDFEILNYESLPESVYMIVDKKVELDLQPISDLPEWSFLPENELKRNAILLFENQRSAKRNCSRNQRVIKIPNTSIFELSKSYLVSKGITRLILDDSIIALDN